LRLTLSAWGGNLKRSERVVNLNDCQTLTRKTKKAGKNLSKQQKVLVDRYERRTYLGAGEWFIKNKLAIEHGSCTGGKRSERKKKKTSVLKYYHFLKGWGKKESGQKGFQQEGGGEDFSWSI